MNSEQLIMNNRAYSKKEIHYSLFVIHYAITTGVNNE